MRQMLALLIVLLCSTNNWASTRWGAVRHAAEVADQDDAAVVGEFADGGNVLHLAPDGQYTRQTLAMCGMGGPLPISIGHYRVEHGELVLLPPDMQVDYSYDEFTEQEVAQGKLLLPEAGVETAEPVRLLLLPLSSGLRLLDETELSEVANLLNYNQELPEWLLYRRVLDDAADAQRDDSDDSDDDDALSAADRDALPERLRSLLRDGPSQAQVTRLINADELDWKAHEAELQLALNRGEHDGLYLGMSMQAQGYDDFSGEISAIDARTAVLRITLSRFHPDDVPPLPQVGDTFATPQGGDECHSVPDFAIAGRITSLDPERISELQWDADGYAYLNASIDVGARAGLISGDEISPLALGYASEGRVELVQANSARVLIRLHRYSPDAEVAMPGVGDRMGTRAWAMEHWDELER